MPLTLCTSPANIIMKINIRYKQHLQWLLVLLALLLPFFIIRSFPNFYHSSDMDDFWRWSQVWEEDWRSIYINCERCNYPFLGTMFSGGVMSWLDVETFARLANRFRYALALIDAFNILLIWLILQNLRVKNAPLWAGIIGMLPSSWLGSSVWGQIDGVGQFFILVFFLLLVWFNQPDRSMQQLYIFSALSGLLISFMLLTKQLIYFSAFALILIFFSNVLLFSRRFAVVFASVFIASVSIILPVLVADFYLDLKAPYFFHLQYILVTGSRHGEVISYIGFNVWTFFYNDLGESSRQFLPGLPVAPYHAGIILFLLVNAVLFFIFYRYVFKQRNEFVLMALIYISLVNLSFNLMLTGTHERYLYHFYPFILMACLGYHKLGGFFNRFALAVLLTGSLIYGVFLFGYLSGHVRLTSLDVIRGMSVLHLSLFVYLIFVSVRQFNYRT